MPITIHKNHKHYKNKNIKSSACRVTSINGTRNKSNTSSLARRGFNVVLSTLVFGILSSLVFVAVTLTNTTMAESNVSFSIESPKVLSVTIPSNSLVLNMAPESGGTFSSGSVDISVITSYYSGYTLNMITENTELAKTNVPEGETVPTIPTFETGINYNAADFASSNTNEDTLNRWAYKKSSDTNYVAVQETQEIAYSDEPVSQGNGVTTVDFGVKLDNTIAAGNYEVDLNFVATPNPVIYTIDFDANANNDTVTNMPTSLTGEVSPAIDTAIEISDVSPVRDHYNFIGWCTVQPTTVTTENSQTDTCVYDETAGVTYQPGSTYTMDTTSNVLNVTLYAMWSLQTPGITFIYDSNIDGMMVSDGTDVLSITASNTTLNLKSGHTYTIAVDYKAGYTNSSITHTSGSGSLSGNVYTVADGTATITASSTIKTNLSLKINFTAAQVNSVAVKTGSASGTTVATISTSGSTATGLTYGTNYYLVPSYKTGYTRNSWTKNSTLGALSSTSADNPYFTIGDGTNEVTLNSKAKTNLSLKINFTAAQVNSVAVKTGSASGTTVATISTSGSTATGLTYGTNYYLVPSYKTGYTRNSWTKNSTLGALSSTSADNPYFTIGDGTNEVTLNSKAKTNLSLKINFTAAQVNSVAVKTGSASGTTVATISTSGSTATGLTYGTNYYLVPSYKTGYTRNSWTKNSTLGALSSTSADNPYFTIGDGTNEVTLNSKAKTNLSLKINFTAAQVNSVAVKTGSASGTTVATISTSGSTATGLTFGTKYYLVPSYKDGYQFSSWSGATVGSISSTSAANPYFTVGDGANAITLNSKQNNYPLMKDYTKATCQSQASSADVTVKDERDNNTYTVRYINGNCWMTQNLRFTGTSLNKDTTNVTANKTLTWYDLKTNGGSGKECNGSNGYSNACRRTPDSTDLNNNGGYNATQVGQWYNYYGATAGTISGSSNSTEASQDICPKNWHLPTGGSSSQQSGITSYKNVFSTVRGGDYYNGSLYNASSRGLWWSSTAYGTTKRYVLRFNGSNLDTYNDNRYSGLYVRCIRSS